MTKTVTTGKATDLITFTRASTGTYLDSVKYGDELVTNGDFSNGTTGWDTSDGNITVVNGQLVVNATPTDKSAYQQITLKPNTTYKVSIQLLTDGSYLYAYPQHNSNANTISGFPLKNTTSSGSVVNHSTFLTTTDTGELRLRLYTTNGDTGTFDNLSVKEVIGNQGTSGEPLLRTADTNEPRIEYDADGNLKGLLIEEASTNHVSDSEDMVVPFSRLTPENTTSPTGEATAKSWKISDQTSGYWYNFAPINSGTIYTASVFVKLPTEANNAGLRYVRLGSQTTFSADNAVFDLQTGTQTSATMNSGFVGSSITPYGNGWYRISITDTATSTSGGGSFSFVLFPASNSSGGSWTQTSDMVGKYLLHTFGWQTETGSFPTSYIPTSGSTVTRTNEVASLNASLFEYNGNEGTTLIEFDKTNWAYSTTFPRAYSWGHGSQSVEILNEVYNYGNSPSNSGKIRFRVDDSSGNGVFGANFINGSESDNTAKVALALKDNDMAIAWKGTVVFTDTTGSPAIDLVTKLYIGSKFNEVSGGGVSDYMNGHIKSIKYYPVRLTNDEIKALTL